MRSMWNILFLFAISVEASKFCARQQYFSADFETYTSRIRYCIADCLGVIESSRRGTECAYNSSTGKSKGCSKYFTTINTFKKRLLFCEKGFPLDGDMSNWKACDVMYFDLFSYNKSSKTLETMANINETIPFIEQARSMGIKVIARLYIFNPGDQLIRISENEAKRNAFVKTVVDTIQLLELEGLYFFWEWPACNPEGFANNCVKGPTVKKSIIQLILSMAKPMKDRGKMFVHMVSGAPTIVMEFGDYFTEISPFVDYYFIEMSKMAGHWNAKSDFNFNLKIAKEGLRILASVVKDPLFLTKMLMTVDPYALSFEHKDPTAGKILSTIIGDSKKVDKFLNVSKCCKLIKGGKYKVVRAPEIQHWAIKDEHIFIYDDVESLKQKVEWFMAFGAGINFVNSFADDAYGSCGFGPLPYLKGVAELLKSKDCEPLSWF